MKHASTYQAIRDVVLQSGLWDNGRERTHGFLLSPSVYEVPSSRESELQNLAIALHDCMGGIGRITAIASNPRLTHSATWGMINRAMCIGVPALYSELMLVNPSQVPAICKVDIMESENGDFRIAEIDGHNKHGLGYSTIGARIRRQIMPGTKEFQGAALALAKEIRRRGQNRIVILYSDRERFYLPEMLILNSELALLGIEAMVVSEIDIAVKKGEISINGNPEKGTLFLDFPFLYKNENLNSVLKRKYLAGEVDFLIPPKPFLGSKAVLALLRNDEGNEELEAILKSQISSSSLQILRQYIPRTFLVYRRKRNTREYWMEQCSQSRFVLKESISSGMKGTVFSDDANFGEMMERACNSYYRFILQEEVVNRSCNFQYFDRSGNLCDGSWFMRVTVHFAVRKVADIIITARQDKKVHGAPDCIQLGALIV